MITNSLTKNYYPFGTVMSGRSWSAESSYRYGFNGKEGDDEFSVDEGSYDFGARMYDSRLGRWSSVDPCFKKYAPWSPYSSMNCMPIICIDPNGKDPYLIYNNETNKLYLYDDGDTPDDYTDDIALAIGDGHNNVTSSSSGKWQDGIYPMLDRTSSHMHGSSTDSQGILLDSENGSYGEGGIFRAQNFVETGTGNTRTGMGIHAGRANKTFFERVTLGCIRTTADFFEQIVEHIGSDAPLTKLVVVYNRSSGNSDEAEEVWDSLHNHVDSPIPSEDIPETTNSDSDVQIG